MSDALFQTAVEHHRAGRLPQAEALYREILAQNPDHFDALHMLGVIAHQAGRSDVAADLIGRVIAIKPDYAEAYGNLGNVLRNMGQLDAAIAAFRQAIALKPLYADAYSNLGNALKDKGQFEEALAVFHQAIALIGDYADGYYNIGNLLKDQGRLDDAIAAYRRAIALQCDHVLALNNLGVVLKDKGLLDAAFAAYRQAISVKPDYAEAYNNLGVVLKDMGQPDAAISACRRAVALKPDFYEALYNLGINLKEAGQLDEAIASYRTAIELKPDYADAYNNLGNTLNDKGQLEAALAAYRQAIAIKPDFTGAHSNLILAHYYHPGIDSIDILREARCFDAQHTAGLMSGVASHDNDRDPLRRLRIGYVSHDFSDHPVGRFALPLLEHHDHKRFEIFCYASLPRPDAVTERLMRCADAWRTTSGQSDEELSHVIRGDRIDILVDLSMHTAGGRPLLFARKPAPIQVAYLAYPGTTGLSAMDYRISDPYLDPPEQSEAVYTEKTLRLPHSFWCYEPPQIAPPVNDLPAALSRNVTFGCLNNFCKLTAPTLELWAVLMRQMPVSKLVIHAGAGSHQEEVRHRFAAAGVESGRIRFVGLQPMKDYFAQYGQIDIALDPFPYGGGTTTCDALWMGVPVVTLAGRTAVGRAGVSLLSNVGLTPWIARTSQEYLAIAREWAADLPRLAELRRQLRPMMLKSVLMDGPRFAAGMEAAYGQMWVEWCENKS